MMELSLSTDVLEGLQLIADNAHIPDGSFSDYVVSVCESLYDGSKRDVVLENTALSSVDPAVLKEAYSAVATFLLEAVKTDQNVDSLSHLLEDVKFSPDRIALFNKIYTDQKPQLQILLSSVGKSHPNIVDVDWRVDYCLKNNQIDRVNEPTFLISLKTQQSGRPGLEPVQLACTQEQLQDLVTKLRDACKSLERTSEM
ncbi:COMM domain-containing protein 3 [Lamellibrachia satsuma]|nr:COMM domain-containing protein 3 [Lamellibrachia satsuma]